MLLALDFESSVYTNSTTKAYGAGSRIRTGTGLDPTDFKSGAATCYAIPAYVKI